MTARALQMVHDRDPKEVLQERAAPFVDGWKVQGELVLVATYIRPEKTKSGIIITQNTRREDEYQGKVGLVLKMGPDAFKGDPDETRPGIGDWVVFNIGDTKRLTVDDNPCRFVDYRNIQAVIPHPDIAY